MYGDDCKTLFLSQTATFIALISVGGWIAIPFFPVPITLQTLFVLLSGVVMKRHALYPSLLYIFMGAIGLPVFHNGMAGIGILLGPTGGYILGFAPAAAIVGLAYEHEQNGIRIAGLMMGSGLIYLTGVIWLIYSASVLPFQAILIGVIPFILGDLLKAAAAFALGERIT